MLKSGPGVAKGSLDTVGDAAESARCPMTVRPTHQLRNNVRWHAPLDRNMTADDVVFSWDRFSGNAPGSTPSTRLVNLMMVTSVTAADPLTVVWKLKEPYPFFLAGRPIPRPFSSCPRRRERHSTHRRKSSAPARGCCRITSPTRSSSSRVIRWHFGPDLPYFDNIVVNIIPTYATQLSQFQAGNLDTVNVAGTDLNTLEAECRVCDLRRRRIR